MQLTRVSGVPTFLRPRAITVRSLVKAVAMGQTYQGGPMARSRRTNLETRKPQPLRSLQADKETFVGWFKDDF